MKLWRFVPKAQESISCRLSDIPDDVTPAAAVIQYRDLSVLAKECISALEDFSIDTDGSSSR